MSGLAAKPLPLPPPHLPGLSRIPFPQAALECARARAEGGAGDGTHLSTVHQEEDSPRTCIVLLSVYAAQQITSRGECKGGVAI